MSARMLLPVAPAEKGRPHVILRSHPQYPGFLPPQLEGLCTNEGAGMKIYDQLLRLCVAEPCHVEPGMIGEEIRDGEKVPVVFVVPDPIRLH